MTVKEMRAEVKALSKHLHDFDFDTRMNVMNRKDELFLAKGYNTKYLRASAKKAEVEDYLECMINAYSDCHVDLDNFYYYDED